ncbi:hypothetical protein Droror1_Dr00021741 [Drosera rotundifolia]
MEDSFQARVDKAFGALSSHTSTSSLWRLTDEEIERRKWNRDSENRDDGDGDVNFPSSFDGFFAKKAAGEEEEERSEEGGDEEEEREKERGEEEWDVRNGIGMDCTLDFEAEEDEFDKQAVGREKSGERVYMSEVTGYVPHINTYNELPRLFKRALRDPRANHSAAKLRLKEDSEAAGKFNSLRVSDETVAAPEDADAMTSSEDGKSHLKSILKRKETQMDSKSEKRVRFEASCITNDEMESKGNEVDSIERGLNGEKNDPKVGTPFPRVPSSVPDYVQNPSRYTCYTLESTTDMDEKSNRQAFMDFLNVLKGSKKSDPEDEPADLSKPVIFIPRRKEENASSSTKDKGGDHGRGSVKKNLLSVCFEDDDDDAEEEISVMEEDTSGAEGAKSVVKSTTTRRYRSKITLETEESIS